MYSRPHKTNLFAVTKYTKTFLKIFFYTVLMVKIREKIDGKKMSIVSTAVTITSNKIHEVYRILVKSIEIYKIVKKNIIKSTRLI